jgi:hypothetical protein
VVGEPQIILLNECVLCVDCESVTNTKDGHCLRCESTAVFNISRILKTAARRAQIAPIDIRSWSFRPEGKASHARR